MSITISLTGNTSTLVEEYFPPIELPTNYVCGLIDFVAFNSIPNVDVYNNLFHIGNHVITIPVGSYELEDIDFFLNSSLRDIDESIYLIIEANNNTLKTEITSSMDIDFSQPNSIGKLLGFSKRKLEVNSTKYYNTDQNLQNDKSLEVVIIDVNSLNTTKLFESDLPTHITNVNTIRIESNLTTGSFINNTSDHTIHEFPLDVPPGYKINEKPRNVIYLPVNCQQINNITIRILNQDGELINFRGEKITLRLHFKPE